MAKLPLFFVDATIFLSADDRADPARRESARAWLMVLWQQRRGRTSIQVLNDYYVQVTRHFSQSMPLGDARAKLRRLQQWKPWQIDHQTVESAWGFEARFGLHYPDALTIAAAAQSGCTYLLTDALPVGKNFDAIQVLNPFATDAAEIERISSQ